MANKYQIIFLGSTNPYKEKILESLLIKVDELGVPRDSIAIIEESNFNAYKGNSPAYCLYYGDKAGAFKNIDLVERLQNEASLILPIVDTFSNFGKWIPAVLKEINGFDLSSETEVERLVSCVLEGLSLLRLSRRLFISYRREESTTVAIQLFEQLEKAGFDVFLDTHSVRPGEVFQEELWHRLADTDVVVLLNTNGFLKSYWTTQELARANAMSIGILQLIWPDHKQEREAELSTPLQLTKDDFGNEKWSDSKSYLIDKTVKTIVSHAESIRARSIAARQDNLIAEFIQTSKKLGISAILQPEKFLVMKRNDGKELVVIPTVGVPQAFTYHQCEELANKIKSKNVVGTYLLYDHMNIRERWLTHLDWLNQYLKVKTVKIYDVEKKITELANEK